MKAFFRELFNVPNTMSLIRVACAPLLAVFWLGLGWHVGGLALGTIIGLTDLFDGVLARKLKQITELGALIDQLGDLVFESTCLIIATVIGELPVAFIIIYLFREFMVMVLRAYVMGKGGTLPSNLLGKAKSSFLQWAFFLFFLGLILLLPGVVPEEWTMVGVRPGRFMVWTSVVSISIGLIMSVLSGFTYLKAFANFYILEKTKNKEEI